MNLKIFLVVLLLTSVFCISTVAFAQTMTEAQRQALIFQIQQQIVKLQTQLAQMLAQQQGTSSWCHTFNNNFGYTSSGTDEVFNLHLALQAQGISYSPDNINIYSSGTSQGIIQFQSKYGITPQTGFVGQKTRAKLNQLYGCSSGVATSICKANCITQSGSIYAVNCSGTITKCSTGQTCQLTYSTTNTYVNGAIQTTNTLNGSQCKTSTTSTTSCTPNWQTGAWSACTNSQQTRTVTDSNNCGVTTSKPVSTQSCTIKQIDIQAGGSDGPVNNFLTLGSGASVNGSGINLSQSINLQWTGVDVSSCRASDSLSPTIFSGYKLSSGSQAVVLSGNIQGASSKVSDTFKITCISTTTGSSVQDSVTVNLFYTVTANCTPNWQCSDWSTCASSRQTKTCTDSNGCGSLVNKPLETQSCVMPPTVNIKAKNSEGPISVTNGVSFLLSWTSSGAASCIASGDWSGTKVNSGTESATISRATPSKTFTITCTNTGGTAADSVTVNGIPGSCNVDDDCTYLDQTCVSNVCTPE